MTKEEYKTKLDELEHEFSIKKQQLARNYAYSNNTYKIGDVISDHATTLKITGMSWTFGYSYVPAYIVYRGIELTKNGEPKKRQNNTVIRQTNIKTNGKN